MGLLEAIGMGKMKPKTKEQLACALCTSNDYIKRLTDEKVSVTIHNHNYDFCGYGSGQDTYSISLNLKDRVQMDSLEATINHWIEMKNAPMIAKEQKKRDKLQAKLKNLL